MEKKQVTPGGLIIIGGSSGSLEALFCLLPELTTTPTRPIVLILHRHSTASLSLAELLNAKTSLHVKEADEKELLENGCIYLAPADYHLLFEEDGTISLDVSEKVHFCRPSIDVSFTSASIVYKERLIAILLSGANADGAAGMQSVKACGGFNIVQDPAEAQVAYMPEQAIHLSIPQKILKATEIGKYLQAMH